MPKNYNAIYREKEKNVFKESELNNNSQNVHGIASFKENESRNNCDVNDIPQSFSCTVINKFVSTNSTFKNDSEENNRLSQAFKTLKPDSELCSIQSYKDSENFEEKSDGQRFSNVALQTSFQDVQDESKRDSISTHGLFFKN